MFIPKDINVRMSVSENFQLVVYESDFGLPSFDVDCTKSILYALILKLPLQVKSLNNLKFCTFYNSPVFIHKNLKFKSFNETVLYLQTLNYNADIKLSAKQCSETLALTNYVLFKLKPLLEFIYWIDPRNSDELTNVWFMKAVPFPFNYIHTKRFREKALALIESMYPKETNMDSVREYLIKGAEECFSILSFRLGNNEYFFGGIPTTLDVVVYSSVAAMIKVPFPNSEMSNMISLWPNLQNFVKRIDNEYFPNLPKQSKYIKLEAKSKTSDEDISYIAIAILTVSATSLILGFAVTRGLISLKTLN